MSKYRNRGIPSTARQLRLGSSGCHRDAGSEIKRLPDSRTTEMMTL
jgi:hypothetical protein